MKRRGLTRTEGVILGIQSLFKSLNHGRGNSPFLRATFFSSSPKANMVAGATVPRLTELNFPITPVPKNPLGEGKYIMTAAALVIGCVPAEIQIP